MVDHSGKRRRGFSLKYRIAVIIFVLEALMMATVLAVTITYSSEENRKQLVADEQVMLGLLADLSRSALLTAEYDNLQPYIDEIVLDTHIETVVLSDHRDRVVVSSDYRHIGELMPQLSDEQNRIWLRQAISNGDSAMGTLAMSFSHAGLIKTRHEVRELGIAVALTGMSIIALLGIAIGFLLTRRLDVVASTAQRMAGGDFSVRTELQGNDELALVGQSFDRMAGSVEDSMAALSDRTDELERQVAVCTTELAEARDDALSAERSKSTFLANMSHEIRTPLTAIIGFSESLRDIGESSAERLSAVDTIIHSGRHLLGVVNDILDLSRIEAHKLEVERVASNTFELLADVKAVAGMQAREKGLSFSIDYEFPLPGRILTDPTRLKQILLNLSSNAIKFTEKGGVRLVVGCSHEEQQLCLSVIDTGIGMSPRQQASMFQPFSQADASSTRRFGGTGLGLYIARQLSELLGGSTDLKSLEGVGTRVDVTIATGPIDASDLCDAAGVEQCEGRSQRATEPPNLSGRVLLAEDSSDNQRLISMYIRRTGAEVELADNGREAVESVLAGDYDLVLMDMQMPVMDGMEATQWLRKAGHGGPVVALTANVMKEERERCISTGCDAFLGKPIDTADFYEILARYLPAASAQQAVDLYQPVSGFDVDLFDLTEDFVESLPGRLHLMRQYCERADWRDLGEEAHKLKGIAGSFGFPAVTKRAAAIEQQVKQHNHAPLQGLLGRLEALCEQAVTQFRRHASLQTDVQEAGR